MNESLEIYTWVDLIFQTRPKKTDNNCIKMLSYILVIPMSRSLTIINSLQKPAGFAWNVFNQ